jgi:hypothetical protein
MAELLYDVRLREDSPFIMAAVRTFLTRISVHPRGEIREMRRRPLRPTPGSASVPSDFGQSAGAAAGGI